ncbi:hypothetical protein [Amycolatopsis keratiniphila]|uniref:Uncharacterized protein n=1 Tax=Amycolatopsis keratiniphila subsp. keratiniphila TaxID=227715 RepID=A0A1W2LZA3_9PSEU|nr:hypothetical protein [Amycolatopsis keratiniphila]ONF72567.1 hypothetical protein AVR91_0210265 [Amycolatopsis keratiniphila subsp. keratiniphila]
MAFNTDRVTVRVGETLETAQTTKATGAAARDNTDLMHRRAQGFHEEGAQGQYGDAIVATDRRNQRLANEQWNSHDLTSNALTNGVHSLTNARDQSIARLGNMG